MNLFFNGEIIKGEAFRLSPENRALNYGDGLFETMKFSGQKTWYLKDHYERIQSGTKAFKLRLPENFTVEFLEKNISILTTENKLKESRIKILMWRKAGGLFSPESEEMDYMILAKEWHGSPSVKSKIIFSKEKKDYSSLSGYKVLSSALYIMAGIEKKEKNAEDVILLNHNSEIVECLSSNIFWEKNSMLFTPALQTGCIGGVMRKRIITHLKAEGITVQEGHYSKQELLNADFAFTSNIGGLSKISSIESSSFSGESALFSKLLASV
jgi:4-amino-4-deoxychorismate lyase